MKKAIRANTIKLYKIKELSEAGYDPVMVYRAIVKKKDDIPLSDEENDNCYRCFAICTTLAINKTWPEMEDKVIREDEIKPGVFLRSEGVNRFQQDMLQEVVIRLAVAYYDNPIGNFLNYILKEPSTKEGREHLHRHVSWKARNLIKDFMKNRNRDYFNLDENRLDFEEKNKDGDSKGPLGDRIEDDKYDKDEQYIRTELDDYVISTNLDKSQITKETQEIFDKFFLSTQQQLDAISSYFKNQMLVGLKPSDIWTIKLYEWDSVLLWDILTKIDIGELISSGEKKDLYLFYLMVCILELRRKNKKSVMKTGLKNTHEVIITKPFINPLAELVIKTFLYYLNDLEKKVFCNIDDPPPREYMEVKKFLTAIKYKPRDLLKKTVKLPSVTVIKPALPKPVKKALNAQEINSDDFDFPPTINIQELFESYEVFEELTDKITYAFQHGTLDHLNEESMNSKILDGLKSYLSENKIALTTIFTFLNPMSQKEKDEKDYAYITQGALSSITTGVMSQFKKEDGKLQIILTKDENSLDTETIVKSTTNLIESMVEKDFDIKRGEVSAFAAAIIEKHIPETDTPFKVSIPEGAEYDSFRTMVDMNGPIKVSIPFAPQGDKPFWENEEVLDDKMIQMIDKSITDKINQANIGRGILSHL